MQHLTPRKSLNKAFLKVKPSRVNVDLFKSRLSRLLDQINPGETEEFHKNILSEFLKDVGFSPNYYINTRGRNDLVIHSGPTNASPVSVIIETKSPTNKSEMVRLGQLNAKAMHELLLYYLQERVLNKNHDLKHLIISNINEWFIFDAKEFEKHFYGNKALVKSFEAFASNQLAFSSTDAFYKELAKPAIDELLKNPDELGEFFTYIDLNIYEAAINKADKQSDIILIPLLKIVSPEHLLKLPFANDNNSLDRGFYNELLHIIGLTEIKDGGKRLIVRRKPVERESGTLLENTIAKITAVNKLAYIKDPQKYGAETDDQLLNLGIELVITWINRILFLKLLEAQLISYNKDSNFAFLNTNRINTFEQLDSLFFEVLACEPQSRNSAVRQNYETVPYLNSSLFEPTEVEHQCFTISQLDDTQEIKIFSGSVLKDDRGRRRTGSLKTLQYLFDFLDAYDFGAVGEEEIQEDSKALINASVLGLIFEKINGYKDGSFYTPGFVTMRMCRETIRLVILEKFNLAYGSKCRDYSDLYNLVRDDKNKANAIINSLRICDPAVGSGHFLVSALNEILSIKSELQILQDRDGKSLRDYRLEVSNDELVIFDDDGRLFTYRKDNRESQRVQEAIFHEKQIIIENCLFGVDINPNSVKICRLRLWIELLKNAYYRVGKAHELETLPNIDINIKCGNSLLSKFPLDVKIGSTLRKSNFDVKRYLQAVESYRHAKSKGEKWETEKVISRLKKDLQTEIGGNDPLLRRMNELEYKLNNLGGTAELFELTKAEKRGRERERKLLMDELDKVNKQIEEIKTNSLFDYAFEWRMEFPEVLRDDGSFMGFDAIIGNPPYISAIDLKKLVGKSEYEYYKKSFVTAKGTVDAYIYFFELGYKLLKENGILAYITPNKYLSASYGEALRTYLISNARFISIGDYSDTRVFEEAATYPVITLFQRTTLPDYNFVTYTYSRLDSDPVYKNFSSSLLTYLNDNILGFLLSDKFSLTKKIIDQSEPLNNVGVINATSTAGEAEEFHEYINEENGFKLINTGTIDRYSTTWGQEKLTDKGQKFLTPFLPRDSSLLGENRFSLYSSPKIILAKMALRTEAFYDKDGTFSSINTNCIHTFSERYDPRYIIAWLNSKPFQFLFDCFFSGLKMQGGYLPYTSPNLINMYIKYSSVTHQDKICTLVDRLHKALHEENADLVSKIEAEIDVKFYDLLNLTTEERHKINLDVR
jgi:adenine-specific DNA-methyltransferase